MKLVIYETTHHETLPSILDLSLIYFENTTVFLRELTYRNISGDTSPEMKWPHATFIRQKEHESNRSFIKSTISFIRKNNCTHFHISTLDNNLLYFAFHLSSLSRIHISLSIQAINEYAAHRFRNIRDISESVAKFFFHQRIRSCRVFFPAMVSMLEKKISGVNAVFIPSRFFSGMKTGKGSDDNHFSIVIPGSVDPVRRDYEFVIEFLNKFLSEITSKRILQLVILGNKNTDYGERFIKSINAFVSDRFQVKSYSGYIPQSEYESQLRKADLIWSPIQIDTVGIRGSSETYGISTATGLTADLLVTSTPALVPSGFNIPEHYEDALIPYHSSTELAVLINQFVNEDKTDTQKRITESLSFFSTLNFKREFEQLMEIKI